MSNEIVFYGLRRSGNHAIIHWLLRNVNENVKETLPSYIHSASLGASIVFFNDIMVSSGAVDHIMGSYSDFNYRWVSVEDEYIDPKILPTKNIIKNPQKVFILRDPINCFCSRLKTFNMYDIDLFESKVLRFLDSIGSNDYIIYYNYWNKDRKYRDKVAKDLGFENKNDDRPPAKEGGGSRFKSDNYNERIHDTELNWDTMQKLYQLNKYFGEFIQLKNL